MRPSAERRHWHEGTAARYASRSRYSLRGWACGFASGTAHNPHCPFGHSCLVPTLILFAPTLPASGTLRRGIKVRQCAVVCNPAASLSRRVLPRTSHPSGRTARRCGSHCGTHRASSQASFMPIPPLRLSCSQGKSIGSRCSKQLLTRLPAQA